LRRGCPLALSIAAALALAGCTWSSDMLEGKKIDYKSAGSLPPLEVPPDLTAPARDNRYVVPETGKSTATLSGYQAERAQQGQGRGTPVAAASTTVLPSVDKMRIERSGDQRWLVVQESPEKLWPLVRDFWQENGFLIAMDVPDAGVMETDWAENRAKIPQDVIRATLGKLLDSIYSTAERDKFRTRMERAADGSTEIYISHRGMVELYTSEYRDNTRWQPRPPDPGLEAEFLRRLMVRLGAQEEKAKEIAAVSGAAGGAQARATIKKGLDGTEQLEVFEPFDRTWRRVGLALDRVGFTVEDRDRQKGQYFVRYADPEAEMGKPSQSWLNKLAFWRSDDPKVKAEQYRVQVTPAASNSEVRVLNKDGQPENSQTSRRILALLNEQLR
jgi:outer membrane protein assembly factor BamC